MYKRAWVKLVFNSQNILLKNPELYDCSGVCLLFVCFCNAFLGGNDYSTLTRVNLLISINSVNGCHLLLCQSVGQAARSSSLRISREPTFSFSRWRLARTSLREASYDDFIFLRIFITFATSPVLLQGNCI